jgi:hypothetical protein
MLKTFAMVARQFYIIWVNRTRNFLLLSLGFVIGISATISFQQVRRVQAIRALPSLNERSQRPAIDEIPGIVLSRHDGELQYTVHNGMGGPLKDFEALLADDHAFSIDDPIWSITFEPGVTMEDLESTLLTIHSLGVKRYFLGSSFYGKLVQQ